jgi:type IV pilus assembly protein PilM
MVTLDIEDTCIRMVVVKGKRVEKAASLPLEPGLVTDGVVIDKAAVSQRIKELMAAHGITEKQVVVSISGIHSIFRVVSLPRLPNKMLDEAARREIDRVMPVPLNELYTSWQAAAVSDIETAICLVGLPRSTIDAMIETLHQAGLESQVMDIRPLALARLADEKDAIIISIEPVSFDIVVMIDGIPELLRSLSFPTGDISAADKVSVIKEELDRTITFYNSSRKGNPITRNIAAFISGELKEMLAEVLDYPIKPLPQLLSYPEGFDASEYAANIGLALKQVKVDTSQVRVNVNVIPEVYLPKPRPVVQVISWALVVIAIGVLLPLAMSTQQAVRETLALQAQVNNDQIQVQVRQGTQATIEKLQKQINEAETIRDTFQQPLDNLKTQRAKVNGDLGKVTSLLPGIVELKTISYSYDKSFSISGTAPDETTILSYASALRNTGRFEEVTVSNMHELEFNNWEFTLTLK